MTGTYGALDGKAALSIAAASTVPLMEEELASGHFDRAVDLAACVGICRAYRFERVILGNIRVQLRHLGCQEPEVVLFASLLLRHVSNPDDQDIHVATKAAWNALLGRH